MNLNKIPIFLKIIYCEFYISFDVKKAKQINKNIKRNGHAYSRIFFSYLLKYKEKNKI